MRIRGTFFIAVASALALAGCGQTSGVDDNSANLTVTPVDAEPVKLESAPDEPIGTYSNPKYGFTIAVPDGWTENHAARTEDGTIFENKALNADLRVYGSVNDGDGDYQQSVEAMREGTTDQVGGAIGDEEYRGASTADGDRIELRMFRKPEGPMVSALMRYPIEKTAEMGPVAKKALDSLTPAR